MEDPALAPTEDPALPRAEDPSLDPHTMSQFTLLGQSQDTLLAHVLGKLKHSGLLHFRHEIFSESGPCLSTNVLVIILLPFRIVHKVSITAAACLAICVLPSEPGMLQ